MSENRKTRQEIEHDLWINAFNACMRLSASARYSQTEADVALAAYRETFPKNVKVEKPVVDEN